MASKILRGAPIDWGKEPRNFIQIVLDNFAEYSPKTFLIDDVTGRSVTYSDALKAIKGFAASLQQRGLGKGDVVTIMSQASIEVVCVMFGTWLAGCTVSGVNWSLKNHEILDELRQSQPDLIYTSDDLLVKTQDLAKELPKLPEILITSEAQKLFQDPDLYKMPEIEGNDPLLIVFTSGSTGMPKGVVWSERSIRSLTFGREFANFQGFENVILMSEIFWISFQFIFCNNMTFGAPVVIPRDITDYENLFILIEKYKPEHWFSSHTVMMNMLGSPNRSKYDLSSLKTINTGGAIVSGSAIRKIAKELFNDQVQIYNLYGSSEMGIVTMPCEVLDYSSELACIGQVKDGVEVKIVDLKSGSTLGPNEVGEILIKSECRMIRLLRGDMSKGFDDDGFFHSGDVGYYDSKDRLYITSRVKEVLKYRHHQVFPPDLEKVLNDHPDVVNSCVVGKFDEVNGDLATAFVVRKADSTITEAELVDYVSDRVSEYKRLHGGVYFIQSLPMSRIGKVQRAEVKKLLDTLS